MQVRIMGRDADQSSFISSLVFSLFFCCLLFAFLPAASRAQDASSGAVRGTVVDSTGGRIGDAAVVLVNLDTGFRYSIASDAEGRFAFELLPPGDYALRATAGGMSPQVMA